MRNVIHIMTVIIVVLLMSGLLTAQDTTMTITPEGNIGIGLTNPATKLHILGASGFTSGLGIESEFGDRAFFYYFGEDGFVVDSYCPADQRRLPLLFQPNGGNVGIGTDSPTSKLEVKGSLGVGDIFRFSNHLFSTRVAADNDLVDVAVFGSNEGTSGFEAGVYGRTVSPQGFGVYSEGNLGTSGNADISGNVKANGINTGAEALKIVRGVIGSDGTIFSGSGFSVTKDDVGIYTVTFDEPFSDFPSVSNSVINIGFVQIGLLTSPGTTVTFWIRNPSTLEFFDSNFTFTAIGGAGVQNGKIETEVVSIRSTK